MRAISKTGRPALFLSAIAGLLGLSVSVKGATVTDISGGGVSTVNDARFEQYDFGASGTGVVNAFLGVDSYTEGTGRNKVTRERGYNTGSSSLEFGTKGGGHTSALRVSEVPLVNIGGTACYEFLLDASEPDNTSGRSLILSSFEIYLASSGNNTGYPALGTRVYNLDSGGDVEVKLNGAYGNGNGSTDLRAYIPAAGFASYFNANPGRTPGNTYLYLYSEFLDFQGGFEEWAVRSNAVPSQPSIPLPSAMWSGLVLLGLVATLGIRRRLAP